MVVKKTKIKGRVLSVSLSAVLALLLILPYVAIPVNAATSSFVYEGAAYGYVSENGTVITGGNYHEAGTGLLAYCLDHDKDAPDGGIFTEFTPVDPGGPLDAALYWGYPNGYPNDEIFYGVNESGARYATQLAIWAIQGQMTLSALAANGESGAKVKAAAIALYNKAQGRLPDVKPTINMPATLTAAQNPNSGSSARFGPFSVSNAVGAWVGVTDGPAGWWAGAEDGTALNAGSLPIGAAFYIYVPINRLAMASAMKVSIYANYNVPQMGAYFNAPNEATQPMARVAVSRNASSTISDSRTVSLSDTTLTKTTSDPRVIGNDNYSLAGAQYALYLSAASANTDTDRVATITTSANGASGKGSTGLVLPYGTYYAKEIAAPKGYVKDTAAHPVTVGSAVTAINVIEDPILGGIELVKTSSNPEISAASWKYTLKGAVYGVYTSQADAVADRNRFGGLTTDENGVARLGNVPMRTYYVKEVARPYGFYANDSVYKVDVDANGTAAEKFNSVYNDETDIYGVQDEPTNDPLRVRVEKQDKENPDQSYAQASADLSGAEFTIRYYGGFFENGEKAATSGPPDRTWVIITNNRGLAELSEDFISPYSDLLFYDMHGNPTVPMGTILIQETKAPEGYLLPDPNPIDWDEVLDDGTGNTYPRKNRLIVEDEVIRGDIHLTKVFVDETDVQEHAIPEEGIIFDIYAPRQYSADGLTVNEGAKPMLSLATDSRGLIRTKDLGLYVIEGPDGTYTTRAREEGDSGALPYGTYLFVQRNTTGYRTKVSPFTVFIQNDGEEKILVPLQNVLYHSAIKIYKEDSETGKRVPVSATWQIIDRDTGQPVEMIVWYPQETHITEFVSNENGELILPERLASGKYGLKEITAPAKNGIGYVRNAANVEFDIPVGPGKGFDDPIIVTMEDVPAKGQITVIKSDGGSKGGYVKGAVYTVKAAQDIYTLDGTLRASKGDVVDTVTTGADGRARTKQLYLGRYTVQEKANPYGYVLDKDIHDIGLAYEGQDVAVVQVALPVTDMPVRVELTKLDSSTEKPIQGASFRVTGTKAAGGTYTDTQASDKDGHVLFEYIPPGEYTLSEYQKVPGYLTNETEYGFTVDEDGTVSGLPGEGIVFYNGPTTLELDKVDGFTGAALPGAGFTITAIDGRTVDEKALATALAGLGVSEGGIEALLGVIGAKGSAFERITFDVSGTKVTVMLGAGAAVTIEALPGGRAVIPGIGDAPFTLTGVTDEDGCLMFKYIPEGTYTLSESGSPDGYLLDRAEYGFTVDAKGNVNGISEGLLIENEPTAVEFDKIDSYDGMPLAGATFTLTGTTVGGEAYSDTAISDENGHVAFRYLPAGVYSFIETGSPEGYFNDGKAYTFRVNGAGEVAGLSKGLTIKNTPSAIEFSKADGFTKAPLEGAAFKIEGTALEGSPYEATALSGGNGRVKFMYIPAGSFTLTEISSPDTYLLEDVQYAFNIDVRGNITGLPDTLVVENMPTTIGLDKTDALSGGALENAEFAISGTTAAGRPYLQRAVSDANGHVAMGYIPEGSYTLRETANPDGYLLEDISFAFTVNARGEASGLPENLTVENRPTTVEFEKIDGFTGKALPGAEFAITGETAAGKPYEAVGVSDAEGRVVFNYVPEGRYTLRETASPAAYVYAENVYNFEVNHRGEAVGLPEGLSIGNAPTSVEMGKADAITGERLPGAQFGISGRKAIDENALRAALKGLAMPAEDADALLRGLSAIKGETPYEGTLTLPQGEEENGEAIEITVTLNAEKDVAIAGEGIDEIVIRGLGSTDYHAEGITDENGHISFRYLPEGYYYIAEMDAPDGYVTGTERYSFEVNAKGEIYGLPESLVFGNGPTTAEAVKLDSVSGLPIEGVEFTLSGITASGGLYEAIAVTDGEGHILFEYVPEGGYTLKETKAATGYMDEQLSYGLTVDGFGFVGWPEDMETAEGTGEIIIYNTPTAVEVQKLDATGKGFVSGAVLEIHRAGEELPAITVTTESEAAVIHSLPAGEYTLHEKTAPLGYKKAADVTFSVSDQIQDGTEAGGDGWVQKAVMYDERETPVLSPKTADTVARILFILLPLALLGAGLGIIGLRKLRRTAKQTG